jgi:DNA-binding GntR family transcriptional regulator
VELLVERDVLVDDLRRAADEGLPAGTQLVHARERLLVGGTPEVIDEHIALNEEFHRLVLQSAGSPRLSAAMKAATGIPRAFRTIFWSREDQRRQSLFCHRQLVAALRAHRAEVAEAVMRMHILGATAFLKDVNHGHDDPA